MVARSSCRSVFTLGLATLVVSLSATNCELTCPKSESSSGTISAFGTDECVYVAHLPHDWQQKNAEAKYEFAANECAYTKIGQLNWRMPKVDTVPKNKDLYRAIDQHPHSDVRSSYVWIGLRRHGPWTTDKAEWADSKYWHWTVDNVSMLPMKGQGLDFWENKEPDNSLAQDGNDLGLSKECVLAKVDTDKLLLDFHSSFCDRPNRTAIKETKFVRAFVCVATPERYVPIHERWWFYPLCAGLIAISLAAVSAACYVSYRYVKKKKRRRYKKKRKVREPSDERDITPKLQRQVKKRSLGRWYQHPDPSIITKSVSVIPTSLKGTKLAPSPFPVEALKSKTPTSGTTSSMKFQSIKAPRLFDRTFDDDVDDTSVQYSNLQPLKKRQTKAIAAKSPTVKAATMAKALKTLVTTKEAKSPSASMVIKGPSLSLMGKDPAASMTGKVAKTPIASKELKTSLSGKEPKTSAMAKRVKMASTSAMAKEAKGSKKSLTTPKVIK